MWSNSVSFAPNHSKFIIMRISNIFSHAPVLLHACLNQFQRFNFPISCIFDPQYLCNSTRYRSWTHTGQYLKFSEHVAKKCCGMWSNSVSFAPNHSKFIIMRISNIFSHAPVLLHACLNQFQRFNFPISCIFDPQYLCSCDVNRSDFFPCFLDHILLTFLPWRTILTIFGVFSLCSKPRTAAQIMKNLV